MGTNFAPTGRALALAPAPAAAPTPNDHRPRPSRSRRPSPTPNAPTGRALACRFGEQVVTAEFVNVSVVRCVPPAIARPTTVPFSVAHDYEHDSPLPALRIDPDTGRAVGGVPSGASRGRALGWHPHTWGWHAADETGGEAADDTADVALGLGGDNQRSKLPALWAEPTVFTFYGEG